MKIIKVIFIVGLFSFVLSCGKNGDQVKFVYPIYGGLRLQAPNYDYNRDHARNLSLKKWGFDLELRGGCIPFTEEYSDSLKLQDGKMYQALEKKYGKDWIQELSKDVKTTYIHLSNIRKILDTLSIVKLKEEKLKKIKHYLIFKYDLDSDQNYIIAKAKDYNTGINLDTHVNYSHFQITFDVRNYSIVSINDHIQLVSQKELDY